MVAKRKYLSLPRRDIFRDLTWGMNALDPLAGLVLNPRYYCSMENVPMNIEEPSLSVPEFIEISRGLKPLIDQEPYSSLSYDRLLDVMPDEYGRIPLSVIAFQFGFPVFCWAFDRSNCSELWGCSSSGWMVKRELINQVAALDGWDECDVCGMDLGSSHYSADGKVYPIVFDEAVKEWVADFVSEVYPKLIDSDCLATKKLLYMLFQGVNLRWEGSEARARPLLELVSFLFDLTLFRMDGFRDPGGYDYRIQCGLSYGRLDALVSSLYEAYAAGCADVFGNIEEYINRAADADLIDVNVTMDQYLRDENTVPLLMERHDEDQRKLAEDMLATYRRNLNRPYALEVLSHESRFDE